MLDAPKTCWVSYTDRENVKHSVQVVAHSRNEAAIRGLAKFRAARISADDDGIFGPYIDSKLTVTVVTEESHEVRVSDAMEWLNRQGKAPRQIILKNGLRELLQSPLH